LNLKWDGIRVPISFQVDFVPKVAAQIDAVMAAPPPPRPYMASAQFYLEYGLDLKKAQGWVDTALADKPMPYYLLLLRARILAKEGDRDGAIAAANQAIAAAKKVRTRSPRIGRIRTVEPGSHRQPALMTQKSCPSEEPGAWRPWP